MKLKTKIFILITILITVANISLGKENRILVKVNNEIITTIDIINEINFLSTFNKEFEKIDKNQQIKIAKNSLIKDKIKSIELLKYKKNLNIEENIFEQIIKNYINDEKTKGQKNYKEFFESNNLDIAFVKKKISIDTFWKGLIYEKFHKNVKIDNDEIKKSIEEKEKTYEYMLSEIVFTLDMNETLNEKLQKITNTIKEKSFVEAAFNFSISDTSGNGGKLGWIKESVLNKKIKSELKNINLGEFTKPITIPGGFLILNKENIREINKILNIDDEIKSIINKKTNDQLNRLSNIYLNKIKKNIQINEI